MRHACKRIIAALLALLLIVVFGCTTTPAEPQEVIVARVGDIEITRTEYRIEFQQASAAYSNITSEDLESFQSFVLSQLIKSAVLELKYEEYGLSLTDAEVAEVRQSIEAALDANLNSFLTAAQEDGAEDPAATAEQKLLEEINTMGFDNRQAYTDYLIAANSRIRLEPRLRELVTADITLTEEGAMKLFEKDLITQKLNLLEDPTLLDEYVNSYLAGTSQIPALYIPEGYVRVKQILITEEEVAQDVYQRLLDGEDYDALLAQYGEDVNMMVEPDRTYGYIIGPGMEFEEAYMTQLATLENVGEFTAPFETSMGFFIVKLVEIMEARALTWGDVSDFYTDAKLPDVKQESYEKLLTEWIDEIGVQSFVGRVRDIGQQVG